ncbi:DUF982 domain-containing protein [Chelativorans sp.]|uniref:DUF982 domain-containing protein n=1 Tax=Chelativorans sp. TaxID=2203393 RepID=UPI0035C66F52
MEIGHWSEPVAVRLGPTGGIMDAVDSTLEAVQVLIHQWPVQGGPLHRQALAVCFDVLDGSTDVAAARQAFVAAAEEAGILA